MLHHLVNKIMGSLNSKNRNSKKIANVVHKNTILQGKIILQRGK